MKESIIIPYYRMSDPQAGKQRLLFYFIYFLILWYWKFGEIFQKLAKLASPIFKILKNPQFSIRKKHHFILFCFFSDQKKWEILEILGNMKERRIRHYATSEKCKEGEDEVVQRHD